MDTRAVFDSLVRWRAVDSALPFRALFHGSRYSGSGAEPWKYISRRSWKQSSRTRAEPPPSDRARYRPVRNSRPARRGSARRRRYPETHSAGFPALSPESWRARRPAWPASYGCAPASASCCPQVDAQGGEGAPGRGRQGKQPLKMEMKVYCTLTKEQASLYAAVVKKAMDDIQGADGN